MAVDEVRRLLEGWAAGFARRCRLDPNGEIDASRSDELVFGGDLERDEAEAFLRAYKAGLVVVDPDGRFRLPGVGRSFEAPHLIGRSGPRVALHTEYLINIGAYAELVLDFDWPAERLSFQFGAGEFDIGGFNSRGELALLVEAKARVGGSNGLDELEASFERLEAVNEATVTATTRRKWARLRLELETGPLRLWLVASGARRLYHCELDGTGRLIRTPVAGRP